MARWTGDQGVETVLDGASNWKRRCLLEETSILSDEPLWTLANLRSLRDAFLANPLTDSRDFVAKLQEQLAGAPAHLWHLSAEVLWLLCLFPSQRSMKTTTKRELVEKVWSSSGDEVPASEFLDDVYLHGIGHPGTAYNTHRPAEFGYLLRVIAAFKDLGAERQASLLQNDSAWEFAAWLDEQPDSERRLSRNVLLFLLFPDYFERNTSREHREQIYEALKDKLPLSAQLQSRRRTLLELDQAILEIRKALEAERGTTQIDFYQDDIKSLWFSRFQKGKLKNLRSWMDSFLQDRGLKFNTSGRDTGLEKLRQDQAIDPTTGFWRKDSGLTAKPPRWLIHFDLTESTPAACVPNEHRSHVIGFANTKGGDSGALSVRILPIAKLAKNKFQAIEQWEWQLIFCFPRGLKAGSAAQAFDNFNPDTGALTYMGEVVPYIFCSLLRLNGEEESYSAKINGDLRTLTYGDATRSLEKLIKVDLPSLEASQ